MTICRTGSVCQNVIHHAPSLAIRRHVGTGLRTVWNASGLPKAEAGLAELVKTCRDAVPKLAGWLEENVPEGLTVLDLPGLRRRRLRISYPTEHTARWRSSTTPSRSGFCERSFTERLALTPPFRP